MTDHSERPYAALVLGLVPFVFAVGAGLIGALAGAGAQGAPGRTVLLGLGWLAGVWLTVAMLGRRWGQSRLYSPFTLVVASLASAIATLTVGVLTAPWQDLMSQPHPTPIMVVKDLTSAIAPFMTAVIVPWVALTLARHGASRHEPGQGSHAA